MEKKLYDLKIDPELRDFIPPLSDSETELLTESIIEDGCNEPLIVWNGVIVDGHNRYRICHENNIPFAVEEKSFESKDHAKLWMAKRQLGRRNLKPFQRCELVYPLEKIISEETEKRRRENIRQFKLGNQTSTDVDRSDTGDYLAQYADVSRTTWFMAKAVIESADDDLRSRVRSGQTSITAAYKKMGKKKAPEKQADSLDSPAEKPPYLSDDADELTEPASYIDHPMEDPVTVHEPEREEGPYKFVKEQVEFAIRNMIADMKVGVYCLSNNDFDKKKELKDILKEGCRKACQIIDELEKMP